MTDYSQLVDAGHVKRGRFARRQVEDCLRIARRDLATAKSVIETSPEWAFNIAYNAMHQAGRPTSRIRSPCWTGCGGRETALPTT